MTFWQNKKRDRFISLLLAVIFLLGITAVPARAAVMPQTELVVHKLHYLKDTSANEQRNTGKEMDPKRFNAQAYDPEKFGDVGFTVYRLDDPAVLAALKENPQKGQAVADEVEAGLAQGEAPYGARPVGQEVLVDSQGQVKFSLDSDNHIYVIVETTHPETVVAKAKAMLVQLPLSDVQTNQTLKQAHLYPKNEVEPVKQSLKKYVQKNGEAGEVLLPGAMFQLYKGTAGQGQAVGRPIVTDDQGSLEVTDLLVGDYYFVELELADLVDGNVATAEKEGYAREGVGELLTSAYCLNNANNRLTFTYNRDGRIRYPKNSFLDADGGKVVNYARPEISKAVVNHTEAVKDFTVNETIQYAVSLEIPHNIADYTAFSYRDRCDGRLLQIDTDSLEAAGLTKGTDFVLTPHGEDSEGGYGYTVDFVVDGQLTDAFTALAGKTLTLTYEAVLTWAVEPDRSVDNTVTLTYKNGPEGALRYDRDEEEVVSYGRQFVKVDDGLWGSGVAGQGLGGAQFLVANAENEILHVDKEGQYLWKRAVQVMDSEGQVVFPGGYRPAKDMLVLTSEADGHVAITGLKTGTYRLIEVKTPVGFRIPLDQDGVTAFEVGPGSYALKAQVIENERTPELPMTGREQLVLILGAGVLALGLLVIMKRKNEGQSEEE